MNDKTPWWVTLVTAIISGVVTALVAHSQNPQADTKTTLVTGGSGAVIGAITHLMKSPLSR